MSKKKLNNGNRAIAALTLQNVVCVHTPKLPPCRHDAATATLSHGHSAPADGTARGKSNSHHETLRRTKSTSTTSYLIHTASLSLQSAELHGGIHGGKLQLTLEVSARSCRLAHAERIKKKRWAARHGETKEKQMSFLPAQAKFWPK